MFLVVFLLSVITGFAQPWANLLPSTRAIRWDQLVGLPSSITFGTGGTACPNGTANCVESFTNGWTPDAGRTKSGSTVTCANNTGDVTTIQNALNAATPGQYVLLGATTCNMNANITVPAGITLRGSGPMSTILNQTATASINVGSLPALSFNGALTTAAAGATSITITGAGNAGSSALVGTIVQISQCNTGYTVWVNSKSCNTGSAVDNGAVYTCDDPGCAVNPPNNGNGTHAGQVQLTLVTSFSGNCTTSCTLGISPPLAGGNWASANAAHVEFGGGGEVDGAAVEDLSLLESSSTLNGAPMVQVSGLGSWAKGLRIAGPSGSSASPQAIAISGLRTLVMSNYTFGQSSTYAMPTNNEPFGYSYSSFDLVLNNIMQGGAAMWGNGWNTGTCFAYNYTVYNYATDLQAGLNANHGPGMAQFICAEGNRYPQINWDNNHVTNDLNTGFRNLVTTTDGPIYNQHTDTVQLQNWQRFNNMIGNVVGNSVNTTNESHAYQGTGCSGSSCSLFEVQNTDALTAVSYMRWGNVDIATNGPRWCAGAAASSPPCSTSGPGSEVPDSSTMPVGTYPNAGSFQVTDPANHNLPCTFIFSSSSANCAILTNGGTGLSWWKNCISWSSFPTCNGTSVQPYPPIGPDQSGGPYVSGFAYDNPAAVAFQKLPIDTSLQGSFTITASSFAAAGSNCTTVNQGAIIPGPCETLTVTFNANMWAGSYHIVGGFQFGAGINTACKPTSGVSYTGRSDGEILIIGENQATSPSVNLVYSLPGQSSDPGCTGGAFLWPDVRQFDETIFQNDPAISSNVGNQFLGPNRIAGNSQVNQ